MNTLNFSTLVITALRTTTAVTKDGTKILTDHEGGFIKDAKIFIVSPKTQKQAPDGSYELSNDKTLTVKNGVITKVTDRIYQLIKNLEKLKESDQNKDMAEQIQRNAQKKNSNPKNKA